MNKKDFYSAILLRDRALEKQQIWLIFGLIAFSISLIALMLYSGSAFIQTHKWLGLAFIFTPLFIYLYLANYLRKRLNKKYGVTCPQCGVVFEWQLLLELGFTDSCGKCGTKIFN